MDYNAIFSQCANGWCAGAGQEDTTIRTPHCRMPPLVGQNGKSTATAALRPTRRDTASKPRSGRSGCHRRSLCTSVRCPRGGEYLHMMCVRAGGVRRFEGDAHLCTSCVDGHQPSADGLNGGPVCGGSMASLHPSA